MELRNFFFKYGDSIKELLGDYRLRKGYGEWCCWNTAGSGFVAVLSTSSWEIFLDFCVQALQLLPDEKVKSTFTKLIKEEQEIWLDARYTNPERRIARGVQYQKWLNMLLGDGKS